MLPDEERALYRMTIKLHQQKMDEAVDCLNRNDVKGATVKLRSYLTPEFNNTFIKQRGAA